MTKHLNNLRLFLFLLFSSLFALTPLEKDEIILKGRGKIQNGRYCIQFFGVDLSRLNGLYLNLEGLVYAKLSLNGREIWEGEKFLSTIDLSDKKNLLRSGRNEILIYSYEEGKEFSFQLWGSYFRWYFGTFHIHTTYSDGIYSVSELLNMVNSEGGNFCAISDHDTLGQCYDTAFHRTGNCEPIRATEWTTDSGHANILGPEGANTFSHRSVREMIDDATYRGGLVQINHPCDDELGFGWDHYPNLDPGIDGIEIFNGPTWFPNKGPDSDAEAVAWWHNLLTQGKRIAGIGNSDYHGNMPGEDPLGAHSAVYASSDHPDTILKALKLGRVMVSDEMADSRLYLYADTNNNSVMDLIMGENIIIPSGSKVIKFRLEVEDADILDEVVVYSREGEIYRHTLWTGGDYEYEWERTFTSQDQNFMRVELLAWDDDYEYCTNPIYVNYPDYELGPVHFTTSPINLPETLLVGNEETLFFSLSNTGLVSPHRFGILVAVETASFDITDWQRQGPGIGEVRNIPNLNGYEIVEWKGGYPYSVRLTPQGLFTYWCKVRPRREGWQRIFYRSWADDRLFVIEKDPETGFLGPDNERWKMDSIFVSSTTPIAEGEKRETKDEYFHFAPNPAKDRLKIVLRMPTVSSKISLRVYDIKGSLIKVLLKDIADFNSLPIPKNGGICFLDWNLSEIKNSGIYFLVLEAEGKKEIKKVSINK